MRLWDFLFIKGSKFLFRVSLAIFHLMEEDLLKCEHFGEIMKMMESTSVVLQDTELILQLVELP